MPNLPDTVDSLDAVDSQFRGLYRKVSDSEFSFNVPDSAAVVAKNSELLAQLNDTKNKNAELVNQVGTLTSEMDAMKSSVAKPPTDEDLDRQWTEKYNTAISERDKTISQYKENVERLTAGSAAKTLATAIARPQSVPLLEREIARRLTTEWVDGQPSVKVLDRHGVVTANTTDDLRKELEGDPQYKPLLAGSKANGGGITANTNPGNGGTGDTPMPKDDFLQMSPEARMEYIDKGGAVAPNAA